MAELTERVELAASFAGTVVRVDVSPGDDVGTGAVLMVLESMKMEHVVEAATPGRIDSVAVAPGDAVQTGDVLLVLSPAAGSRAAAGGASPRAPVVAAAGPDRGPATERPELAEVRARTARTSDAARPAATERRHAAGRRTARENVEDLCDPGSFEEYGGLVVAAQRARRSKEDLIANTPADGLITGIGRVNGDLFEPERARCAVLSYDYSVLAGTQGQMNHKKKDRLFALVDRLRLPVVLFAEGGGGRPGDTDTATVTGLDTEAFALFGALSGRVPLVGIVSGRCFAGNAALLGCCHVIIATPDATIGMGGPAMIEGGGLGVFAPEDVGPVSVQVPNGVVDVLCADEKDAVEVARRYLSYFQGDVEEWTCADQALLRDVVPPDRRRVYDVRRALDLLADEGSVLELRPSFAPGMVTALARLEGRPVGVLANNPQHLAGAIDAANADKAARFMQLCEAFGLPLLSLCDTPGFMVGPEAEEHALVRHVSRMFVVGASLRVPYACVVLRKGYGLGAQAMAGGSFHRPLFTVAWPTGELGGMGLEGAVRLGFRRELEAIEDPGERDAAFAAMVFRAYEHGKALHVAEYFEIDDVIDPAETRARMVHALESAGPAAHWADAGVAGGPGQRRPFVDAW
ncbi:MAG TPA: carboxyl transferase domain-containing protein [Acidimicrobiales bacterium]|nr:carboxyl transferase domain-containing protein [Acidimicrobiales bacterium]